MPPKVVYGKKAAARPTSASYTKFLSPEKDALFAIPKNKTNKADSTPAKTTEQRIQDELSALEAQLGGLAIDNDHTSHNATEKDHSRARKVLEDRDANAVPKTSQDTGRIRAEMKAKPASKAPTPPSTPLRTPIAKSTKKKRSKSTKKSAQLPTPEPTPERDDIYTQHVSSLLPFSDARKITTFEQWSSELEPLFEITKIAEASFSEVYRLSAISATTGIREESVLKVVALKTPAGEPLPCQKSERAVRDMDKQMAKEMEERKEKDWYRSEVADVLSEVKLLQNLNHIPGFTNFRDLGVLQGRPSSAFNNAWKAWNKERPRGKKSYFADPSKKSSYEDTQLWAVVEMQDAGIDCEKLMEAGGLGTVWEVWDVFWGVCLSIAKAEEACRFEHRDLHMGNICVRSSRSARSPVTQPAIKDPLRRKFRFSGLETTVIDYTLSRADIVAHTHTQTPASPPRPQPADTEVAFLDLDKDPALFEGDAAEEYQYEIYRYMRGAALYNNPLQTAPSPTPSPPATPRRSPRKNTHIRFGEIPETPQKDAQKAEKAEQDQAQASIWRAFHPKSNLVWTHFVLHKLLTHLSNYSPATTLSAQDAMRNVELGGEAALQVRDKAVLLRERLGRVAEMLCPVALGRDGGEGVGSVKELVLFAVGERWLRERDVSG